MSEARPPGGIAGQLHLPEPDREAPRRLHRSPTPSWSAHPLGFHPTRSIFLKIRSSLRSGRPVDRFTFTPRRIFLVGVGEGAAVAYRLRLSYPERFAGVVAINGWLPSGFAP